jgi:hypothetical protein
MSRFAQNYRDAGQMPLFSDRVQYMSMMYGKRDIEQLGARLLSEYRARRRAA